MMTIRRKIRNTRIAPEGWDGNEPLPLVNIPWTVFRTFYGIQKAVGICVQPKPEPSTKIISDKYRFLLIAIPKVGTRTFRYSLVHHPTIETGASILPLTINDIEVSHKKYLDYFKFTFVRNPWARVVSCYIDKIKAPHDVGRVSIISKHPGLKPGMSFEGFVEWLSSEQGQDQYANGYANAHWISQHKMLQNSSGNLFFDFIGKIENIEHDFESVRKVLSMPKIELVRRNVRGKYKWSANKAFVGDNYYEQFYTKTTRDLIMDRYRKDIDLFEYDF